VGAPHETGGKFHEMPCHRTLEGYLAEYIERARLDELEKPSNLGTTVLERRNSTASGFTEPIHGLWRRAKAAGITTEVSNPTFRGAGVTAYPEYGERRTPQSAPPQLYERREDRITLDEVVMG